MIKIKLAIAITLLVTTACYNAAMMRVSGESRDTCQHDSDCPTDYMCVKNISAASALGECIHTDNYDPWANRQLEDIIKLENKDKLEEEAPIDRPEAENPDSQWWLPPKKENQ